MTDSTIIIVNVLTALPPTLFALGALLRGNRNSADIERSRLDLGYQQATTNTKTDALIKKTDEIHILTNSNLTAIKADLAIALQRIVVLEAALTRKGQE